MRFLRPGQLITLGQPRTLHRVAAEEGGERRRHVAGVHVLETVGSVGKNVGLRVRPEFLDGCVDFAKQGSGFGAQDGERRHGDPLRRVAREIPRLKRRDFDREERVDVGYRQVERARGQLPIEYCPIARAQDGLHKAIHGCRPLIRLAQRGEGVDSFPKVSSKGSHVENARFEKAERVDHLGRGQRELEGSGATVGVAYDVRAFDAEMLQAARASSAWLPRLNGPV